MRARVSARIRVRGSPLVAGTRRPSPPRPHTWHEPPGQRRCHSLDDPTRS